VAQLSVEGMNKSAIARVTRRAWNTIARWLALASEAARQFNDRMIRGFELKELQADELRTFCGSKKNVTWVFTTLEVWSRLWVATVVGRRSYANTYKVLSETARRGRILTLVLITTDGFKYYAIVIRRVFGRTCVHAQVVKSWCKNRVRKVETRIAIGSRGQIDRALEESEDSIKLNTAFCERSNLTTRRACAYLARKTPAHPRNQECLEENLHLVQFHYNFVRPHRGLRFGTELRTPAMQAGLTARALTFREVFLQWEPVSHASTRIVSMSAERGRTLESAA
jgi:IS1 family transposase